MGTVGCSSRLALSKVGIARQKFCDRDHKRAALFKENRNSLPDKAFADQRRVIDGRIHPLASVADGSARARLRRPIGGSKRGKR